MFGLRRKTSEAELPQGPVLDLSGPRLRRAFEDLATSAEPTGGVERYVTALALKASLFDEVLGKGVDSLDETEFLDLVAFMAPVRRRIGPILEERGFDWMRILIKRLLAEGADPATADARLAAFVLAFPEGKEFRWVRDLGAELLHFTDPEGYPLMTRWVWDARVGTGVLREIWHADDVDLAKIDAASDFATYQMLRVELDGFLAGEGVFRDRHWYVDLLLAHVYAGYINDRGGQYLRNDFTIEGDPMQHTRRMLGLDAVNTETGRTRLRLIDGSAHVFGGAGALNAEEANDAHS
jgi:hypothetical protein